MVGSGGASGDGSGDGSSDAVGASLMSSSKESGDGAVVAACGRVDVEFITVWDFVSRSFEWAAYRGSRGI